MLVVLGSQERTEPEYRALFDAAGFALARVVPTGSAMSLIEGVPVPESVRAAEAANT
jgi:hypothetical protein